MQRAAASRPEERPEERSSSRSLGPENDAVRHRFSSPQRAAEPATQAVGFTLWAPECRCGGAQEKSQRCWWRPALTRRTRELLLPKSLCGNEKTLRSSSSAR